VRAFNGGCGAHSAPYVLHRFTESPSPGRREGEGTGVRFRGGGKARLPPYIRGIRHVSPPAAGR
jgi:hypothetical protein